MNKPSLPCPRLCLSLASLWGAALAFAPLPARAAQVADWAADTCPEDGTDWISSIGAVNAVPQSSVAKIPNSFGSHSGISFDGTFWFQVPEAVNPLAGANAFSLVAVFTPYQNGAAGANWYNSSGLIGMEQGGVVNDWGLGLNGARLNAGIGAPDNTLLAPSDVDFTRVYVAMQTWSSSGKLSLFVNGAEVATLPTTGAMANRNAGAFALGAITSAGGNPFSGVAAHFRMYNSDESANAAAISTELQALYVPGVLLNSAALSPAGAKFVIADNSTAVVNAGGTFTLSLNGTPVPAAGLTVTKTGNLTTVTAAAPVDANTDYGYSLIVPRTGGSTQELLGTLRSHVLPLTLPGAAPAAAGTWNIREYRPDSGWGRTLPAAADIATTDAAAVFTGSAPVFNHSDPELNNPRTTGNFNNDLPFLSVTPGVADTDIVIVGKTKVTVPAAGDYTFSVHSDDGFVMRVSGAGGGRFTGVSGSGVIDPADVQSLTFGAVTGDSNTRGVYHFDAAGTYDITYLGWQGDGGGFYEVAWAAGAFASDNDTSTWALVGNPGDPSVPAYRPRFYAGAAPGPNFVLSSPAPGAGTWGMRTWHNAAPSVASLYTMLDYLGSAEAAGNTTVLDSQEKTLNFSDPVTNRTGLITPDRVVPGDELPDAADQRVIHVARASLIIPTAGDYTFSLRGDDGFLFRITTPGIGFKRVAGGGRFEMSNPNEVFFDAVTGDSDTRAIVSLPAGTVDVEYAHWQGDGGSWFEVAAAPGSFPLSSDTTAWRLVGGQAPGGAVAVPVMSSAGWTVKATAPGAVAAPIGIASAEDALSAVTATTNWDSINFNDPETNGNSGAFPGDQPWPGNTGADDNNYAIQAKGDMIIAEEGDYVLGFRGDDGGYLTITGTGGLATPSFDAIVVNYTNLSVIGDDGGTGNSLRCEAFTGDSHTLGRVHLKAGAYHVKTLQFENNNGSWFEVLGGRPLPDGQVYNTTLVPLLAKGGAASAVIDQAGIQLAGSASPGAVIPVTNFAKLANGTFTLTLTSEPGAAYVLKKTTNVSTGPWIPEIDNIAATGASTTVTGTVGGKFFQDPASPRLFFRVEKK
ncbi:MAG: LamG-like jellyroll fold domain-containing protein [Verrucomicrobiota bacterium]